MNHLPTSADYSLHLRIFNNEIANRSLITN